MENNDRVLIDSNSWFKISKRKRSSKTMVTVGYCELIVGADGKEIGVQEAPKSLTLELDKAQELAAKILLVEED